MTTRRNKNPGFFKQGKHFFPLFRASVPPTINAGQTGCLVFDIFPIVARVSLNNSLRGRPGTDFILEEINLFGRYPTVGYNGSGIQAIIDTANRCSQALQRIVAIHRKETRKLKLRFPFQLVETRGAQPKEATGCCGIAKAFVDQLINSATNVEVGIKGMGAEIRQIRLIVQVR